MGINSNTDDAAVVYKRGLATIAFITFLFASNSPALHAAYSEVHMQPPVLLLNAACSSVAMIGMLLTGPLLDQVVDKPSLLQNQSDEDDAVPKSKEINQKNLLALVVGENNLTLQAGIELGLLKFVGTLANMYGLSQTSADHGSFLIQLTTLFVPLAQGIMGVPIPQRIWTAIALALAGVAMFTQDGNGNGVTTVQGDVACIAAAVMYATYDLRLFHWGKLVEPLKMISAKIVTQTVLSVAVLVAFAAAPSMDFLLLASPHDLQLVAFIAIWSGLAVNALAPFLQVGGQQAVGPARAQILYASQPLWASLMSLVLLGETVGPLGLVGGAAFLGAMMLAATAELPDPNCDKTICET
jgi:drug/metabolite transporter (DMT)-like permease